MNTIELEDELLMFSWGKWAQDRIDRQMGTKPQPWVRLMKNPSGYDEEKRRPIPRAPEDYCEMLDRMIAKIGEPARGVLVCLYACGYGVSGLAENMGRSKHEIRQIRDAALNQLYGALSLKDAI